MTALAASLAQNFLALEPLLIARLADQLADLQPKVKVISAADLAGITEDQQTTPAVQLVYRGYRVVESNHSNNSARIEQTWLAVVATRNARNLRTGEAARADAGVITRRVLKALMGHRPEGTSKPLRLADAPEAAYSAGYQYLPLAFVAELTVTVV